MKQTFYEFMAEERKVNRWFILKIALVGGFCGAVLGIIVSFGGLVF